MCSWNIGKRIFFIILKFIIRSSNMDVHICRCIWIISMSGWIQNSKWIQNAFENEIKNDFEVKEKKEKENWKIKEFKRVVKFIFGSLLKFPIFYLSWKVYLKLYMNLHLVHNWIWFWKQNRKGKRKKNFPSSLRHHSLVPLPQAIA